MKIVACNFHKWRYMRLKAEHGDRSLGVPTSHKDRRWKQNMEAALRGPEAICNMHCKDDWNIDHRRWSKRCLPKENQHKKNFHLPSPAMISLLVLNLSIIQSIISSKILVDIISKPTKQIRSLGLSKGSPFKMELKPSIFILNYNSLYYSIFSPFFTCGTQVL